MMIRHWEVVDTDRGEVLHHVSKHFTRRGAEWSCRFLGSFLRRRRPGFELRVQRREA